MPRKKSAYADAGVDIDTKMSALQAAKDKIQSTATPGVISRVGQFGGLFKSPGGDSILVSSIDGVGTKLKVAHMARVHTTVGHDLVNHCVNDILALGASPLFFLDYIGASRLDAEVFGQVIEGLCAGCRENGCALIGGETAEMPGLYPSGEYDLVGTIVGTVPRTGVITGESIRDGDAVIGLPSSGFHTNGYSLLRRVLFDNLGLELNDVMPGTTQRVDRVLLEVHKSYLRPVQKLFKAVPVRGLAHITGGGLIDNVPRVLPDGLGAEIRRASWAIPPIFRFVSISGHVDEDEMYRVFNMGIGMVVILRPTDVAAALKSLKHSGEKPVVIGSIVKGEGVTLV